MDLSDKMSSTRRRSSRLQNVDDDDVDEQHDNESIALSLSRRRSSTSGRSRRQRTTSTATTDSSSITKENNQATQQKHDDDDDHNDSIPKRPRRSARNRSDSSNNKLQLHQSSSLKSNTKEKRKMTADTTTTTTSMKSATRASKKPRTTKTKSTLSISTTKRSSTKSSSTRKQTKNVTPSPIAFSTTTGTAFGFDSPNEKDDHRSLPSGVVNLYNDGSTFTTTNNNISVEPSNQLRRRRSTKSKQSRSSLSSSSLSSRCEYSGRSIVYSDSSTTESLTVHFIQTYGEEYWNILHESERAIIYDPSKPNNSSDNLSSPKTRRNRRGGGIPFGSPQSTSTSSSSHSSSSMSSSNAAMSKVTPNERQNDFVVDEDWNKKKNIHNLHQQPCESTTLMSVQPNLTPKMRSILVDWLIELSEHFSFESSTLHLAVTMVDRVLASGRSLHGGDGDDEQRRSVSRRRPRSSSQTFSLGSTSVSTLTKDSHNNNYDSDVDTDEEEDDNDNEDEDEEGSKDTHCYLIPRDRFQLLGATCVWLACKVKEISPPKAKEIAYVSDHIYTVEQIKTMERRVCNALNFTFFEAPTPHHFLFEFMRASFAQESAASTSTTTATCTNSTTGACSCGCRRCLIPAAATGVGLAIDSVFRDMAHYLLELGRLPYGPTGRKPSLLAAAVVYLTRVTLGIPRRLPSSSSDRDAYWTPTLEYYTGYAKSDLFDTVLELHAYHMAAETSNLKAVFSKYKTKRFHRVALKTVVLREDLGF